MPTLPTVENSNMWSLLNLKKGSKKQQAKRIDKINKINKPVEFKSSVEAEKETRRTKYNVSRYRMNLWKNPVHRNRLADQLHFPLNNRKVEMYNSEAALDRKRVLHEEGSKTSANALCSSLYNAVYKDKSTSENVPFAVKEQTNIALMLAKKAELNKKERARKEYIVKKLIYKKKIKSKNFHRHQKHRNMKEFEKETEQLRTTDPENFAKRLIEAEKMRALERISQKHRGGSKFAKMQKIRAKYDLSARDAISTMHETGKDLLKKNIDDDSATDVDLSSTDDDDDSEEEMSDREGMSDEEERSEALASAQWWKKISDVQSKGESVEHDDGLTEGSKALLSTVSVEKMLDANEAHAKMETDVVENDEAALQENINELCGVAGENMEDAFKEEKKDINAEEALKDVDSFLPGWNTWTGPGFEELDEKRRKKRLIKAPNRPRKDAKLKQAIIRESVNKEAEKHLVKTIPFPYESSEQFQKIMEQPICRDFNTEGAHKKLVQPRVIVQKGKIIRPLDDSSSILREKDVERLIKNKMDI